ASTRHVTPRTRAEGNARIRARTTEASRPTPWRDQADRPPPQAPAQAPEVHRAVRVYPTFDPKNPVHVSAIEQIAQVPAGTYSAMQAHRAEATRLAHAGDDTA